MFLYSTIYVASPKDACHAVISLSLSGLARIRHQAIVSCQQSSGGDADDAEEPASDSDSSEVRRVCGGGVHTCFKELCIGTEDWWVGCS